MPPAAASGDLLGRPRALINAGCSCFINAVIQALWALPLLKEAMQDFLLNRMPPSDEPSLSASVLRLLAVTYRQCFSGDAATAVRPDLLLAEFYTAGVQEDAHEFFMKLVDDRSLFLVHHLFEGVDIPHLRCVHCGHFARVSATERFTCLSLPVQSSTWTASSVQSALDRYFELEPMPLDTQYVCMNEMCFETRVSQPQEQFVQKKHAMHQHPQILCIQLMRWIGLENVYTGTVHINQRIDVDGQRYALKSVVFHAGLSVHGGHYWSVVQHSIEGNFSWWCYNDTKVFQVSESHCSTSLHLSCYECF